MSLDERLKEIFKSEFGDSYVSDWLIQQIKQAFIDEGWTPELGFVAKHIYGLMTGAEWYERFEKELHSAWFTLNDQIKIREAARRAAGVS